MSGKMIITASGVYDVDSLYKSITSKDIDTNTKLIHDQLSEIITGEYSISERKDYCVASHEKEFDINAYNECKNGKVFRMEEWICKQCKGKIFSDVGEIMDYQIPLKHSMKVDCKGLGKIDLLSSKGNVAYILEMKSPKSTEEPLKAIMEVYTYWRQLGGTDSKYFLENSCLTGANTLKKGIVLFENSKIYLRLLADYQRLNAIMKDLCVEFFIAKSVDEVDYFIKDIVKADERFIEQEMKKHETEIAALKYAKQMCRLEKPNRSYAEIVKERIVNTVPHEYLNGTFNGRTYLHVCKEQKYNFIDQRFPKQGNIKGCLNCDEIAYHKGIKNLNSSQAMCINYFKKFFEKEEYELLLLDTFRDMGLSIPQNVFIKHAQFEYTPNPAENTNFDFYITLSNDRHISVEVKYTENDFGKTQRNPEPKHKYIDKWNKQYRALLDKCVYFDEISVCNDNHKCMESGALSDSCPQKDNCTFYQFYQNYQICRNIAYAEQIDDIVVFLTPEENSSLDCERGFIDDFAKQHNTKNIVNIYWETLINKTIINATTEDCRQYFMKFRDKYFPQ